MYRLVLYFNPRVKVRDSLKHAEDTLKEIKKKWGIEYSLNRSDRLSADEAEKVKRDIRSTSPQLRGRIVSQANHVLPLSRRKKLNLENTPILVIYKGDTPVDVFPHLLGTTYSGVDESLDRILLYGPSRYFEARGLLEDPIVKILADYPEMFEEGARHLASSVEAGVGVVDLLLMDKAARHVVVEVENFADDYAVGQVCRLAAGYSMKSGVPQGEIRKVIVCLNHGLNLEKTCSGAGVELYKIGVEKIIGSV